MEKKVIKCFYHEHPLVLTENVSKEEAPDCYGCGNLITNSEASYVCTVQHCLNGIILHKKCGELPSEIWHPKHPQHPISLFDYHRVSSGWCNVCLGDLRPVLGYRCSPCDFDYDIICEKLSIDAILGGKIQVEHPSHPLTLMRKLPFPFCCDGCGVQDVDMAYICSTCEFMVHKSCASLPHILPINLQYHHHHLSLAFTFPMENQNYITGCDVCIKRLDKTCWVSFCGDCRFFAHIRCVASTNGKPEIDSKYLDIGDDNDGSDVIEFPLHVHGISKELITPFVVREKGLNKTPDVKDMPSTVNMDETDASFSFLFNYHKHPLSLVSEPHGEEEDDSNKIINEEDEDEAENDGEVKICDVCVTPITSALYHECSVAAAACKYFVHSICYFLPKTLSSSLELYGDCPVTHDKNHRFTLYTSSELMDMDHRLFECGLCEIITNGRVYECEGCKMTIDVKCASLPTTIRHASHSHPHQKGLVLNRIPLGGQMKQCDACAYDFKNIAYFCSSNECDFALDLQCAMMPKSIRKHEWDTTHSLPLTFDASRDHPSDFVCDFCEQELHPKKWMYHCRQCDLSFHLFCLKTTSAGWYRNIKFGRRFVLDGIHPNHPLTFNCVTIKRRCDICHSNVYDYCGLECASCNYLVCLVCTKRELAKI